MDCSRDRVHDPFDENVQNGPSGVTSVCTTNTNLSEDVDFGNSLTITGQRYVDGELDKDPLIKNYEDQIPVRLVRSYNLFNQFAPKTGYRYDGLYLVTNFWIGINADCVKHYKFVLLRLSSQEPPTWDIKQPSLGYINNPSVNSASTPVRNCLRNTAPNMYEFRKYSHSSECVVRKGKHEKSNRFSQFPNSENKKVEEVDRGTCESAIVTRHVSKKVNSNAECTSTVPSITMMSENKSLSLIGNQGSKTHNTNISIRTGLYNSSHSTQQDNKKNTSSPFSRTAKSLNIVKTNQHLENWNLSNKDKNKSLEGKNEFPKRVNYVSFNTAESKSAKTKFVKDIDAPVNSSTNNGNSTNGFKHESNATHKEANDSMNVCNSGQNSFDTPINMLSITNCMYKNEFSVHKMSCKEEQELKTLDSLDSLTPDKILHLINNKGHPLSKLLMGNMIGLTSEQSLALQRNDPITDKPDIKDKTVVQENGTKDVKQLTNFEVASDDLTGSRCYKFRRRRKLSRKIMNKPEMIKYNKIHNEKLKKGFAQSSVILGQHLTSFTKYDSSKNVRKAEVYSDTRTKAVQQNQIRKKKTGYLRKSTRSIKNNVGNNRSEARVHLRVMRTIDSSIKKHINKKQRREITNLLIDAKIGPKIRGPRYRRLRSINNSFAKQSYERANSATSMLNKCKINSEQSTIRNKDAHTKTTNCKRVRSKPNKNTKNESKTANLEQDKTNRNIIVSKKIDKVDIGKTSLSNDDTNANNNNNDDNITDKDDNNKRSKFIENSIRIVENKDVSILQSRKRKLLQAVPTESKYTKIEGRLHKRYDREISKPSKTDAVTQCSLIKEPITKNLKSKDIVQNNGRNEQYTFIKIEYSDLKAMKSEVCEAMKLSDETKSCTKSRSDRKYVSCTEAVYNVQQSNNANVSLNSSTSSIKQQKKCSSAERMSAFVPVNIPDNDLKIARLRSIGFKPINFCNSNVDVNNRNKGNKELNQNVAEKYNKYTNEENDIVVYMDDELQYLDIENEDKNSLSVRRNAPDSQIYATIKEEQLSSAVSQKDSFDSTLLEQDLESPWHGWKKVVTKKDTYWVGW